MQLCSFKLPVRQNCSAEVREGEAVYSWLTKVRHFEAPGIQLLPPCQLSQNEWKIHGNARKAQGSCLKRSTRSWFVTSQEVDGWFMMNWRWWCHLIYLGQLLILRVPVAIICIHTGGINPQKAQPVRNQRSSALSLSPDVIDIHRINRGQ